MRVQDLVCVSTKETKKYLLPISDVHWGAKTCNKEKFKGYLSWALEHNAWIVLLGDLIDNSNRASVGGGVYEQELQPQEQADQIIELLQPLAKKKLILGSVCGNHEERTFKDTGFDIAYYMARTLGVPYMRYSGLFKLRVGPVNYTVFGVHGSAGSKFLRTKMASCEALSNIALADIYLYGHVHELATWQTNYYYVDLKNKQKKQARRTFVLTGTFQEYFGTYADAQNLVPGKTGAARIRLNGNKNDTHVSI